MRAVPSCSADIPVGSVWAIEWEAASHPLAARRHLHFAFPVLMLAVSETDMDL